MADIAAITHSRVLKVAIPIVVSNATVPILGAVDTGVVGQLGEAAPIGAVGIGAIILTGLYWLEPGTNIIGIKAATLVRMEKAMGVATSFAV